jgi:hypothetical protein
MAECSPLLSWPGGQRRFQCVPQSFPTDFQNYQGVFKRKNLKNVSKCQESYRLRHLSRMPTGNSRDIRTGSVYRIAAQHASAYENTIHTPFDSFQTQRIIVRMPQDIRKPVCAGGLAKKVHIQGQVKKGCGQSYLLCPDKVGPNIQLCRKFAQWCFEGSTDRLEDVIEDLAKLWTGTKARTNLVMLSWTNVCPKILRESCTARTHQ